MAAIAALIVVMALMSNNRQPGEGVELHMDSYNPEAAGKKGGLFEGFLEGFNKSLTRNKGGRSSRLTDELAKADLKLRVSEYVMVIVGLIVLLCAILFLRFHSPVLALIGIPIGYFAPGFFLKFRQRRRLKAFNNQLGDTVVLLSNALKAGYSFAQALATILDTIAFTIRERIRIQGEIRTLTAQARASGYIITGLPFALALILTFISPTYITPLFHEWLGYVLIGMGLVSIAIGYGIISKITNIQV